MSYMLPADNLVASLERLVPLNSPRYMTRRKAYEELKQLSGQDFGYDIEAWKRWIIDNGHSYLYEWDERDGINLVLDPMDNLQISHQLGTYDKVASCMLAEGKLANDMEGFQSRNRSGLSARNIIDVYGRLHYYLWATVIYFEPDSSIQHRLAILITRNQDIPKMVLFRLRAVSFDYSRELTATLFDDEDEPVFWKEVVEPLEKLVHEFMVAAAQHYINTQLDNICSDGE